MTKLETAKCLISYRFGDCVLVESGKNIYLGVETQDSQDGVVKNETYLLYSLDPNDLVGVIRYVQHQFEQEGPTDGSSIRPAHTGITRMASFEELTCGLTPSFLLEY